MSKWLAPLVATAFGIVFAGAVQAYDKPGFPRLGGYNIGTPQHYNDPEYQRQLGGLHIVIINSFPGWEKSKNMALETAVRGIKSHNTGTHVFTYLNVNERNPENPVWQPIIDKLNGEAWWLYQSGGSGTRVESSWPNNLITNYTMGARPNAQGERYLDWYPKFAFTQFFAKAPSLDGAFTDNFFWKPRVAGDWNRDGRQDSSGDDATRKLHREGMRRYLENLRKLMPGKYQLGNVADWGNPSAVYPEYEGLLNGGVLEHIIGETWSSEGQDWKGKLNSWGSWDGMLKHYRKVMKSVAEPKLVVFNQLGNPRDYQAFRYGFSSCLMDDAYYQLSDATGPGIYSSVPWFDEYDHKLGQAVTSPPTKAWKSGVYRRDFENGIVLVNPRGNGAVTVDLEKEYKRIAGSQDPAVNNGQLTRKVSLKDRDGIVLLSTTATKRPVPPGNIIVE